MPSGITVESDKMVASFKKEMARMRKNTRRGVLGYCAAVVRIAHGHIHPGPGKPYGRLEDTLEVTEHFGSSRPYATAGTKFYRAPWLEFGTKKMAARPFMRPAVLEAQRDFVVDK